MQAERSNVGKVDDTSREGRRPVVVRPTFVRRLRPALAGRIASTLDDAPAGAPSDTDEARMRQGLRRGWIFSAIWLVYLYYPVHEALYSGKSVVLIVIGVVSIVAFGALYLVSFRDFRGRLWQQSNAKLSRQWFMLAGLAVLMIPAAPTARESVLAGTIYISVMAVFTLPIKQGVSVTGLMVVAILGLPRVIPGWETDDDTVFSLLIATFAAWGVTQLIIRNIELNQARQRISDLAVVEERDRVARDVHDILGHTLTVITVKAELAGRLIERDPARASTEIAEVEALARTALDDVRATVGGLRRVTLDGELHNAATALAAAGIGLEVDGDPALVSESIREMSGWTVREAVTNVVRHSGAQRCRITLTPTRVSVEDDGAGPVVSDSGAAPGNGLRGLSHRAELAGAVTSVSRSALGGFALTVRLAR